MSPKKRSTAAADPPDVVETGGSIDDLRPLPEGSQEMVGRLRRYAWLGAAVGVVAQLIAFTGIAEGPAERLLNGFGMPFISEAFLGAFVIFLLMGPALTSLGLAAVSAAVVAFLIHQLPDPGGHLGLRQLLQSSLGVAALLTMGGLSLRATGRQRTWVRLHLLQAVVLILFVWVTPTFLQLSAALWPTTLDAPVYAASLSYGFSSTFALGRLFAAHRWLAQLCQLAYFALPVAFAAAFALQLRRPRLPPVDALRSFLALAVAGYCFYALYPVAGPRFVFGELYPTHLPDPQLVLERLHHVVPVPRNCMPSLHTAWAIAVVWATRGAPAWLRGVALSFCLLTLAATLGLGFHYLPDLVVAFPFALAVHAFATPSDGVQRLRRRNLLAGTALVAGWLLVLTFGLGLLRLSPALVWVASLATVVASVAWERSLHRAATSAREGAPMPAAEPESLPAAHRRFVRPLALVFVVSGFAGLVYQVVFAKSLGLVFGSTANAATVVLATYMAGLAIGSWIGGQLASRTSDPVRGYALAEIGIAIWCLAAPWLLSGIAGLYVWVARGADPSAGWLLGMQLGLGALVLVVPTLLMGLTMPLLTAFVTRVDPSLGRSVAMLYGANTVGAALGALLTGYFILPNLGVSATFLCAVLLNLCVAFAGLQIGKRAKASGLVEVSQPAGADKVEPDAEPDAEPESATPLDTEPAGVASAPVSPSEPRRLGMVALLILGVGGFVSFTLEIAYVHLLAVVAGNSAYAFSLMLTCFLVGLGAGATAMRRLLRRGVPLALSLALCQLGLSATILGGVFLWHHLPAYFASFDGYPLTRAFAERELVRLLVCSVAMVPTALWIGAGFPVAMECLGRAFPQAKIRMMGRGAALNTLGNIAGAVVAGFLLLPALGSLTTLHAVAGVSLVLGLLPLPLVKAAGERAAMAAGVTLAAALVVVQPMSFDLTELASGANVYFRSQHYGKVIDHAESLDGGLTTVAESRDPGGHRVFTLLTNGKFQGDDSGKREMAAQVAFAAVPLLHVTKRARAMVIGLGTGVSTRVAVAADFARTDVVELSGDVVRMAQKYFSHVNGDVLEDDSVRVYVTDGRNFLLLSEAKYDLISMEISSIWFAGAASLYNREFYQLARARLGPGGVLQQWLQLHHISTVDVVSILATARSEFRHVWLYFVATQGIIVACNDNCSPSRETLTSFHRAPELGKLLGQVDGSSAELLQSRLLDPQAVDELLAAHGGVDTSYLVSTDDNLLLEYSTPRGNVRSYQSSLSENLMFLQKYQPASVLSGTELGAEL